MKLQVSFNCADLQSAISTASHIAQYVDIIEIGTILIYHHGTEAIRQFKDACPHSSIVVDTKIVDHPKECIETFAPTNVDYITVMAGCSADTIHTATTAAHNSHIKVMLNVLDSNSLGQSALEAKNLGVDVLLFYQSYNEQNSHIFLDRWDMIRGNTKLPIFVSADVTRDNIHDIITINPDGIIIGSAITHADDPVNEARYFSDLIKK